MSRRAFLGLAAAGSAVVLDACLGVLPPPSAQIADTPSPLTAQVSSPRTPSPSADVTPAPTALRATPSATARRPVATLFRDAALADARSASLRRGVSVLVEDGRVAWIRPRDDEGPIANRAATGIIDASGATIVPGLVDAHVHLTLPGGAHWLDRAVDPPEQQLEVAEENGALMTSAGIRWARDVGAAVRKDPVDGRTRALNLAVRDRWRSRPGYPYVRAAGTWLAKPGVLPAGLGQDVASADELVAAARRQLDDGADIVKLYLLDPAGTTSPWSTAEVRRVVTLAHGRGARVTAHVNYLAPARVAVTAGVDALEHGNEIDRDLARQMAARGTFLVSTLTVMRSWLTFGATTDLALYASQGWIRDRLAQAEESVRIAHAAGVRIAAGTDAGGGSSRANQVAWEVDSLVAAGLEPWEALAAATWRGGEVLNEPDAGVIREGGPADFFLVHGDPLADPAALWRVWKVAWRPQAS